MTHSKREPMIRRSFFDRLIEPLSPTWALNRAKARFAIEAFYGGGYEGARIGRLHRRSHDRGDANAQTDRDAVSLRSIARDFDRNYDIARGVLDALVNNVIGRGIRPEPQVLRLDGTPAQDLNKRISSLFRDWVQVPEVTWQAGYYKLQRLLARTYFRDGEVFAQLITGTLPSLDHGTQVPFSIEALEPDFVPNDFTDSSLGVIQGVGLNTWGRPRVFYVYKQHPGSRQVIVTVNDLKFISADRMIQWKLTDRLHQVRGISVFASVVNRFDDIKDIDESERVAARVAAAMAAYIKKGTPDLYDPQTAPGQARNTDIYPGMMFDDLMPGEDIGTISPNRPNNALIPFRKDQLRAAASGTGTGCSTISRDYAGTYSSQRQELVEQKPAYDVLTDDFIDVVAQPIWNTFIDASIAARLLPIGKDVDRATLYNATHSRPPMPWINPVDEADANALMRDRGWKSDSEIVRERGQNPEEVRLQIKRDEDDDKAAGIVRTPSTAPPRKQFDPNQPDPGMPAQPQPQPQPQPRK